MLTITLGGEERYDGSNNEFIITPSFTFEIEHSLVSLSKWESQYQTPFLVDKEKTREELRDYVKCMVLTEGFDVEQIQLLTADETNKVHSYINSSESATTFGSMPKTSGKGEQITAELIYYWMVAFKIPWEAQHWHLNKLFALVRICNLKQQKPQKRSPQEIAEWQREENERRLAKYNTTG